MGPADLPGLTGPPVWFNPGDGKYRAELHDPRWSGAPYRLFAYPQTFVPSTEAAFRVLEADGYLYVQYQVLADAKGLSASDRVFFTFKGLDGEAAWGVRIDGDVTTPPPYPSDPNIVHDAAMPLPVSKNRIRTYHAKNSIGPVTNWDRTASVAKWLENVAVWQKSPGVAWGVTFRINLKHDDIGIPLTGPLKVAHALRIDTLGGVSILGSSPLTSPPDSGIDGSPVPADSNSWLSTLSAAAPVCTVGITLQASDVGVWKGGQLTNKIAACGGSTPCPPANQPGISNRFRVTARNVPSSAAGEKYSIRADMRVSTWGSTFPSDNGRWNRIEEIPDDVFIVPTDQLTNDSNWAWRHTPGKARIDYKCVAKKGSYCPRSILPTVNGAAVLVELSAAPKYQSDSAYWFAQKAVSRSMYYQGLSEVSIPATIDMKGAPRKKQDVYLYVEAKNMEPHGDEPVWLPSEKVFQARTYASDPPPIPPQADGRDLRREYSEKELIMMKEGRKYVELAKAAAARDANERREALGSGPFTALSVPGMSGEQALDEALPTYRVRVFYDTGVKVKGDKKGASEPVLAPMPSFGFYLKHDGPLYGFTHELKGHKGAKLEKVAENVYRVRDVPKDSKFEVTTEIAAKEEPLHPVAPPVECAKVPPKKVGCGCSTPGSNGDSPFSFLALLALGLTILSRRRFGVRS